MNNLRLVSYNCQALARGLEGVAATLRRLAPDIAALQEIDQGTQRSGGIDQLSALTQALGPDYQGVFVPAMPYDGGLYGLAVLARGTVRLRERLPLPRHTSEEPRIAMLVQVTLQDGRQLSLVNTHLAADYQAERPQALRRDQAQALAAWLQALPHRYQGPLLLCGDCNSEPGSPPIQALCQVAIPLNPPLLTYPSDTPKEAIDHAFWVAPFPPPPTEAQADESQASDHRPLVIDLSL